MNSTPPQGQANRPHNAPDARRPSIILPVAIVGLLIVGGAVAYKMFQTPPPAPAPVVTAAPLQPAPATRTIAPRPEAVEAAPAPAQIAPAPAPTVTAPPARTTPSEPPVDARELMVSLTSLDLKGPISADDARKWKDSLQQLIHQGSSSVASIHDYLAQNLDVNYNGAAGAEQLGYSSLRSGLLDALGQIGGPEATTAMLQTMQSTLYPTDIATLAATLEQQSPGQYQGDILSAVRSQLALAAQDQLGNANVGPLFQLLTGAAANGTDVSADLTQYSAKWPYYAAIDLSTLPNGAGIPSLLQMAQNESGGSQTAAAQALAQMAPQNAQAVNALISLAQQGQLSDTLLAQLAPYLSGRENQLGGESNPPGTASQGLHIANGNQDFTAVDPPLTPDQITQRISVIDQLLQSLPAGDTQSQQALQQQKINLTGRQPK